MTDTTPKDFGWCMIELMGHRQRVGKVREEEIAGGMMLRVDIPTGTKTDEDYVTEYYGTASVYALRPISEDMAMTHHGTRDPRPVKPMDWRNDEPETPKLTSCPYTDGDDVDTDD